MHFFFSKVLYCIHIIQQKKVLGKLVYIFLSFCSCYFITRMRLFILSVQMRGGTLMVGADGEEPRFGGLCVSWGLQELLR